MEIEKVAWGGLKSVVVHDLPAGQSPRLAVVLSHGYGASGTDLVGLAQPLLAEQEIAERVVFIFPAARMDMAEQGMPGARAWWPVDLDRLINRATPEFLANFVRKSPEGLKESRAMLMLLIEEASRHYGLSIDRFVLGGFSQGAMLATDVSLRLPQAPAGLCIFSGGLINEIEWRKLAADRGALTVLQSHGRHDSILPLPMAAALRDVLMEAGADVDFLLFNGDHEIPLAVIERMAKLLMRVATGQKG
jgi:phospholipase/carboxylesterase